jgi:hypothetical protein
MHPIFDRVLELFVESLEAGRSQVGDDGTFEVTRKALPTYDNIRKAGKREAWSERRLEEDR